MRARTALLVSLISVGTVAGVAEAAPKPKPKPKPCKLVTDPANDTFAARYQETANELGAPVPYGPQEDTLDILSVDIASNAKTLTAVIRVKKLGTAATSPGGISFDVNFTIPDGTAPLYLRAVAAAGATPTFEGGTKTSAVATTVANKLADGTGVLDTKTNEIRIHVPIAAFKAQGKGITPTKALTLGEISAGRYAAGRGVFADVVVAGKVYKAGAVNCVTPGK